MNIRSSTSTLTTMTKPNPKSIWIKSMNVMCTMTCVSQTEGKDEKEEEEVETQAYREHINTSLDLDHFRLR